MDPAVLLGTLRDERADLEDRREAGQNLLAWLQRGGFVPHGLFRDGESFGGHGFAQQAAVRVAQREVDALWGLMDPVVTLATLRDPAASPDERQEAGEALIGWLRGGGFIPPGLIPRGATDRGDWHPTVIGYVEQYLRWLRATRGELTSG